MKTMKKKNYLTGLILTFFLAAVMVSATKIQSVPQEEGMFPKEVDNIIQKKCFGCHNTESRNDKAKEELEFDKLDSLSTVKKVGAYRHIQEVINKNEMPPEKFLERFPDNKLTDDDKKALLSWAQAEMEKLK